MNFFKIFKSKFKPKIVNLPYVQKDGTILEVPVKAGTEEIYQKLIRARRAFRKIWNAYRWMAHCCKTRMAQ